MFSKRSEKSDRLKEIVEEMRVQRMAQERMKNSDERELERFHEEARQERIKSELNSFREAKRDEFWKGGMMNQKNIFKNQNNIMKSKNLFSVKPQGIKSQGGMFFKWQ